MKLQQWLPKGRTGLHAHLLILIPTQQGYIYIDTTGIGWWCWSPSRDIKHWNAGGRRSKWNRRRTNFPSQGKVVKRQDNRVCMCGQIKLNLLLSFLRPRHPREHQLLSVLLNKTLSSVRSVRRGQMEIYKYVIFLLSHMGSAGDSNDEGQGGQRRLRSKLRRGWGQRRLSLARDLITCSSR